jgi:probable F420-dependent oxidoreductase
MSSIKVGVQLHPQATTTDALRTAWRTADEIGVDAVYLWDHFFPLYGDPEASHFEAYTLLAAMAVETRTARIGALVTCNSYRNPHLLADMSRTIDHLSGGRFLLGIGSGWMRRDYDEYGYEFGSAPGRLRDLGANLPVIKERLRRLRPAPVGPLPIMIGGGGEKVTLRLVAQHADSWNGFGTPEAWAAKNAVLDDWCAKVGRDPEEIERTVGIRPSDVGRWREYQQAGADEVIVMTGPPFDLEPVRRLRRSTA